jgi:hypothetical protein
MRRPTQERQPTLMAGGFNALAGLREQGVAVTLAYEIDGELLREYSLLGPHADHCLLRHAAYPRRLIGCEGRSTVTGP